MIKIKGLITVFILLFLLNCYSQSKVDQEQKPNIVLINVDDLGWKDLGFMGSEYYETPNLDALSQEGMVFTNAHAGAANCAPSRASMLSGLNTPRHSVYTVGVSTRGDSRTRRLIPVENTEFLEESIYTLPEMLKNAGYVTASIGKWHVGENPAMQGIDYNIGGSSRGNPGKNGYFSPYNIDFLQDGPKGEYLTDRLTREAISFIDKKKDTTFFLYVPFYTVHTPIMGKKEWVDYYKNKKGSNGQDNPEYAAMVSSMDENVGKILHFLKEKGLAKNTLVIFTSDNGGIRSISSQSPLRAGKGSYYEGGIRVPLIIKWPGHVTPNSTNSSPVSHLDFYPTLQRIVDPMRRSYLLDGRDLNPLFEAKTIERDLFFHFPIYLQAYNPREDDGRDPLFRTRPGSVVISGDWKMHEYFEDGAKELYNLREDIGETKNLVEQYPMKAQEMYQKLVNWRRAVDAPVPTTPNPEYDSIFEREKIIIEMGLEEK